MFSQKRKWELVYVPKRPASNAATIYTEVEKHGPWEAGRWCQSSDRREAFPQAERLACLGNRKMPSVTAVKALRADDRRGLWVRPHKASQTKAGPWT